MDTSIPAILPEGDAEMTASIFLILLKGWGGGHIHSHYYSFKGRGDGHLLSSLGDGEMATSLPGQRQKQQIYYLRKRQKEEWTAISTPTLFIKGMGGGHRPS